MFISQWENSRPPYSFSFSLLSSFYPLPCSSLPPGGMRDAASLVTSRSPGLRRWRHLGAAIGTSGRRSAAAKPTPRQQRLERSVRSVRFPVGDRSVWREAGCHGYGWPNVEASSRDLTTVCLMWVAREGGWFEKQLVAKHCPIFVFVFSVVVMQATCGGLYFDCSVPSDTG